MPMNSASGMELPMVKQPHALWKSAFTTARPSPASAITTMNRMAMDAMRPESGEISERAIAASMSGRACIAEDGTPVHRAGACAPGYARRSAEGIPMFVLVAAALAQEPPPIVNGSTTRDYEQVVTLLSFASNGYGYNFCSG